MSLGLQSPLPVSASTTNKNFRNSPQAVLPSPPSNPISDFPMANVPGQGDDDTPAKDPFDNAAAAAAAAAAIRPPANPSAYPGQPAAAAAAASKLNPSFPQQVHLAPQGPGAPAQLVHSAQMVHATGMLGQPSTLGQPSPLVGQAMQYAAPVEKPRDQLQSYELFPEINVPSIVPTTQDLAREGATSFPIDPKTAHQSPQPQGASAMYDRKPPESMFYGNMPVAGSASRITKRTSRAELNDNSPSPSLQSPATPRGLSGLSPATPRGLSGQSSLERRKAHRAYTQKSRNKVNSRFEALLDALPTPPPRLNPRSKAEILEYATETVIRLVSQNNKLELHLALSSSPQLEAWLTDQTQSARTVKEVCHPIMRLFTIGLEWKGAEVWAIDSRAPTNTPSLGQAWTFVPPPSGRGPSREEEAKISELGGFLDSGKGVYYSTTSNEALAVVYRSGKPAWLSCEYKAQFGFEEQEYTSERTRLAQSYGISDVLFVPLILYNHVQTVVTFYNMRSRSPTGNPGLQPQIDPKSSIKVATEAIGIIARRFCNLPGVSEVADHS